MRGEMGGKRGRVRRVRWGVHNLVKHYTEWAFEFTLGVGLVFS